jgi:hypothetical protein
MPKWSQTMVILGRSRVPIISSPLPTIACFTLARAITKGSARFRSFIAPTRRGNTSHSKKVAGIFFLTYSAELTSGRCARFVRGVEAHTWRPFKRSRIQGRIGRWLDGIDLHLQTLNMISTTTNLLCIASPSKRLSNVSFPISKFGETKGTKTVTNLSARP